MDGSWQDDLENLQEDLNQKKVKMLKQTIVRYILYNYIPHHSSRLSSIFLLENHQEYNSDNAPGLPAAKKRSAEWAHGSEFRRATFQIPKRGVFCLNWK